MHALGVPTTRSLAAIATGETVMREEALPGAVLTRVAASHVRIGTFQYFAARRDQDAVRLLADYVIARHYPEIASGPRPYLALLEAVAALSEGDGSAGWCLAVLATSGMLGAYVPEGSAREMLGDDGTIAGGVFAPMGKAVVEDGGLRASGRWRFSSGCEHCDWLMGGCVVEDGGELRTLPSGAPDIRLLMFPRDEVEIIDTWHVAGLRGTGSNDIEVSDTLVPMGRSASLITDPPRSQGPLYAFPVFGLLALSIAACGLGIARGAIDELAEVAEVGPGAGGPVSEGGASSSGFAQPRQDNEAPPQAGKP